MYSTAPLLLTSEITHLTQNVSRETLSAVKLLNMKKLSNLQTEAWLTVMVTTGSTNQHVTYVALMDLTFSTSPWKGLIHCTWQTISREYVNFYFILGWQPFQNLAKSSSDAFILDLRP